MGKIVTTYLIDGDPQRTQHVVHRQLKYKCVTAFSN